jgi:hypothetical protein
MIVPEEKPTELQLMMKMFSMDRQERFERDRERAERDQRMDSMMEHFFESQSKLAERLDLVYEDIEKIQQGPAVTMNTSPNGQIELDGGDDDADTSRDNVFRPAIKESPIDRASDESPDEEHFFMDSANYGFQERIADVKPVRREPDHSRRESKVISDMKYNIQRTESQSVYKTVTAEPFTKKLTKIDITHFLSWYTNWNDHMVTSRTYTEPTNLVSISIREILCENNDLTLEDFHALQPEDFIHLVAKELKIFSKMEFHEKMSESYDAMPKLGFHGTCGVAEQEEFYNGLLARKNYFRKCLELLSIHSSKFAPEMKGDYGLVRIFTRTLDLPYVKLMQAEMRRVDDYKSITEYILHFCEVAKAHLELAKRYSRTPMAANKKSSAVTPSTNTGATVRVDKNEDSTHDCSGVLPKESWQARHAPNVPNGTTADATAARDVDAWVETVPRRYGQHELHTEQDSYENEDY